MLAANDAYGPMNFYVPGAALTEQQLDSKEKGQSGYRDISTLSPQEVKSHFTLNKKQTLSAVRKSFVSGAKSGAKRGWKIGAMVGGAVALAGSLVGGLSFPPSLLAVAITTAIGTVKGALVGLVAGGLGGGLYKAAKTSLHLAFSTPEERIRNEARRGRNRIAALNHMEATGTPLKEDEKRERSYLQSMVPIWSKTAEYFEQRKCFGKKFMPDPAVALKDIQLKASHKLTSGPGYV